MLPSLQKCLPSRLISIYPTSAAPPGNLPKIVSSPSSLSDQLPSRLVIIYSFPKRTSMKKLSGIIIMLCAVYLSNAQNTLVASIRDAASKQPLGGTTILLTRTHKGAKADSNGIVILTQIPDGNQVLSFHFIGYKKHTEILTFPRNNDTLTVLLEKAGEEMGEVIISSTRSNRTIRNLPTHVELINGEELEEKGNMKPGDIRMMLNESTGIQTQQISATSANSSIRIQGLDGRYTQILKDGFPLYAGFSGGPGLLQTPPLDLNKVEIIKASSSTLYGGGAIAGLVNLISKTPKEERELRFLINGTSAGGLDVNGFYGQRWNKIGLTLYGGRSSNSAYDPSSVGFSAIPKFDRYVLNPKLFLYFNPRTKLSFDHQFNQRSSLTVKNSISNFNRTITIPGYIFDGKQWSSYSEIAYNTRQKNTEWVAGLNVYTDNFKEHPSDTFPKRNYQQNTLGGFIPNNPPIRKWLQTEP